MSIFLVLLIIGLVVLFVSSSKNNSQDNPQTKEPGGDNYGDNYHDPLYPTGRREKPSDTEIQERERIFKKGIGLSNRNTLKLYSLTDYDDESIELAIEGDESLPEWRKHFVIPRDSLDMFFEALIKCLNTSKDSKGFCSESVPYGNSDTEFRISISGNDCYMRKLGQYSDPSAFFSIPKTDVEKLIKLLSEVYGLVQKKPMPAGEEIIAEEPASTKCSLPYSTQDLPEQAVPLNCKLTVCSKPQFNACHPVKNVAAWIKVYYLDGTVENKAFPAAYCSKCDRYFVSYRNFNILLNDGFVLDVVYMPEPGTDSKDFYGKFNNESKLHKCGYNVMQKNNLSQEKRQEIIGYVIDYGIMTSQAIVKHLSKLIQLNKNDETMTLAVNKWHKDMMYARTYKRIKKQLTYVNKK